MRRLAGSESAGDSGGFSAFSSCILFNEPDQVRKIERLDEVIVGAALPRFLGDVAIAGKNDVRNGAGIRLRFQCAAKRGPAHPSEGEIAENHLRGYFLRARQRSRAVG